MTKLIWMSDPHFQTEGTIDGLNPRMRLATTLDHANRHHPDAAFIILTGDLVGDDIASDYPMIAQYLAKSDLPVHSLVGNNDDRVGFRQHLLLPENAMPDFIQFRLATPDGLIICRDTHMTGSHAGEFCAARMAWLDATLATYADTPAYLFLHHPPHALHLPAQDEIMMRDGPAFLDLLGRHSNVAYLFMGHVHRTTSGVVAGIPFATLGALSFQAPAPRPVWHWDRFQPPQEAPAYAVVHINDGTVVIQPTQFCDYDVGIEV